MIRMTIASIKIDCVDNAAAKDGQLHAQHRGKSRRLPRAPICPTWATASIEELVEKQAWSELNDRFYRYLEFGTGGMRGRTIGVDPGGGGDAASSAPIGTPEHAAIGSNMLNDFTLIRATVGLVSLHAEISRRRAGAFERRSS